MSPSAKPALLLILDGFGMDSTTPDNAIAAARKPNFDHYWNSCPHTLIQASEAAVGLPRGQMGNSEVGHLNIGAGRVVYMEYSRIELAIRSGYFFHNHVLEKAVQDVKTKDSALHIFGLLSDGGVHSHDSHIHAMTLMAARAGLTKVYLHMFLDGRDTPPQSAKQYIDALEMRLADLGVGRIASLSGRYYAMDRNKNWDRIQKAYELITQGYAPYQAASAVEGLEMAYARGETDEFVQVTRIVPPGQAPAQVRDGDAVVFMNFRADRARQITRAFVEKDFQGFDRQRVPKLSHFCTLTQYQANLPVDVVFPPEKLVNGFGENIANLGLRQLRIAETEKYAHVTFFFNGGEETVYPGEERILVPSPKVATYDETPEMSAREVTDRLVEAIESRRFDAIICNYANPDMVGHTGNFNATVKAIEVVDECIGRAIAAQLARGGDTLLIADHGNAEDMEDPISGQPHTAHTVNLVPFLYIGRDAQVESTGALEDISPTLLYLMGLPQPVEMKGHSLVECISDKNTAAPPRA